MQRFDLNGFVSFRIQWFKFSSVKMCVLVVPSPTERDAEEKEKVVDRVGNGYKLCGWRKVKGGYNWLVWSYGGKL